MPQTVGRPPIGRVKRPKFALLVAVPCVGPLAASLTERSLDDLKLVVVRGNGTVSVQAVIARHVHAEPIERNVPKCPL